MARPRTIDQGTILNAAEAVVLRDGAAHLTLDAVAHEAGISKASVIYDYKTKQALIQAVVDRWMRNWEEEINETVGADTKKPDARLRARLTMFRKFSDSDKSAVAFQLCLAMAQDATLHKTLQSGFREQFDRILAKSENKDITLMAFLMLEGMSLLEVLGIISWRPDERDRMANLVEAFLDSKNKPCASSAQQSSPHARQARPA
ncbi:TetR/AcrR family transcriptional regulator [Aquamicrobium segne]|uniref:TetR/AcrR family transcriptional regulator n=1 Tax=Aquamicrobium segne TaxID=469547 RepID=A0ABW0H1I1_9HYPH